MTFKLKENACRWFCKGRTAFRGNVPDALDKLVTQDVLTPVKTAEWGTPEVPVATRRIPVAHAGKEPGSGSFRVCGDFRNSANAATLEERYPFSRVDVMFAKLNGGAPFATLGLGRAYKQLPLDEKAKMTVLNTHKDLYCFNRLVFNRHKEGSATMTLSRTHRAPQKRK